MYRNNNNNNILLGITIGGSSTLVYYNTIKDLTNTLNKKVKTVKINSITHTTVLNVVIKDVHIKVGEKEVVIVGITHEGFIKSIHKNIMSEIISLSISL